MIIKDLQNRKVSQTDRKDFVSEMIQETVVNRVSLTPGLERDLAQLETPEKELSKPVVAENLSFSKDLVPPVTQYSPEAELVSKVLKHVSPRDPDLALFRKQVIDAFRHLGLDTRKFFVE